MAETRNRNVETRRAVVGITPVVHGPILGILELKTVL